MIQNEYLPEVKLYGISAAEADYAAPLLTDAAVTYLKADDAFGMALVEEDELRAAVCARFALENETVLELLSLYVIPSARRRQLGGTLLMELLEHAMTVTDGSIQYVTAYFSENMEGLEPLLTKAGFQIEPEEGLAAWQVPLDGLEMRPLLAHKAALRVGMTLCCLEQVPDIDLRRLAQALQKYEVEDLNASEMRAALQTVSYVLFDEKHEPAACAIFSAQDDTHIYLSQFFAAHGNVPDGIAVLQASARALLEEYPKDTIIEIPTLTRSSAGLVQKLLAPEKSVRTLRAVLDLAAGEDSES